MKNTDAIAAVLKRAVDAGDVPGVVAAVATGDGQIFEAGFGRRSLAADAAMTPDTVVWIASMTKAETGACAMQLVEQGTLELDEPIARVLPELGRVMVLDGFDAGGQPKLRPPKSAITLRQLLAHTSGFGYDMWNRDAARYQEVTGTPRVTSGKNRALSMPLMSDPGTRWEYGIGIDWVGKAVEVVRGQKLGRVMQERILAPLGMTDTGFKIGPDQRRRLAKIHQRGSEGLVPIDLEVPQEPEFEIGGGGLYSTVGDYLKFTRMILGQGALDGVRVLQPETVALMSANAMGSLTCAAMPTAKPQLSNDVGATDGMKWGLTFLINPAALATGRSAGSLMWAGIANSYYWIDPVRKVTGVLATQILPFYDANAVRLFDAFEREVYKAV